MKKQLNITLIALSLVTIFSSAALSATPSADEYEFTALYNDVVVQFPAEQSKADCDRSAHRQNTVDVRLSAFQYDTNITKPNCCGQDEIRSEKQDELEKTLEDLSFDG